ncbi:hypothetical protein ACNKHK_16230 [Shigella flexneri]
MASAYRHKATPADNNKILDLKPACHHPAYGNVSFPVNTTGIHLTLPLLFAIRRFLFSYFSGTVGHVQQLMDQWVVSRE